MSFLNAGLLGILAPLVALPLAIHLFNRRFPFRILFPDISRILKSMSERSKLARWRHILLTLLRTIIVGLLLLAFLRPVLPRFGAKSDSATKKSGRRVLLIVDRSLSMEHAGDGVSAARAAAGEAGKIFSALGEGGTANVILAGATASALSPNFTEQADSLRARLSTLPRSAETADLVKATALAGTMLQDADANPGATDIYFLSDFQRQNWADATFEALPRSARLFFVNLAPGRERENTALLEAALPSASWPAGASVPIEVTLGNFTSAPVKAPVEAILDGHLSVHGEISAPAWTTGKTTLNLASVGEGLHTIEIKSAEDALPMDNHRFLIFEGRRRETVLILCDRPEGAAGAEFVKTALNPFDPGRGSFAPQLIAAAQATPAQIAAASRIILTSVGALGQEMASRLAAFVENGGGLIYFLDGEHDAANLALIDQAGGRPAMPFQLAGRLSTENFASGAQKLARGDFKSRFLRLFTGANRQALSLLEFYEIQRALPTGKGEVILSYADGTPAMGTAQYGLGTALLCNFAPAELASNIARQRLFPAWIHEMARNLAPEESPSDRHEAGYPIGAELWASDVRDAGMVAPDGKPAQIKVNVQGERATIAFTPLQAGIYSLRGKAGELAWAAAVNSPAAESDLRSIDSGEIARRAKSDGVERGYFVAGQQDYDEARSGRPLFHWFLLAAAAFLLLEMLSVHLLRRVGAATSPPAS